MKIVKTRETKILESIIVELDAIAKPHTENEVYFRYLDCGVLLVDLKAGRRVRVTVLGDHDGIQLECDIPMAQDYKNLVMNCLSDDEYVLAAEYIWNWINVDKGFLMNHKSLNQRIERGEDGNVVRYKKEN